MTRFTPSSRSNRTWTISAVFAFVWILISVQHGVLAEEEPMYYGFFFDAKIAESIKKATDSYLNAANSSIPELQSFLNTISSTAKIGDSVNYFSKPKDPNTGDNDPLYHVTAKYCGKEKQEECAEYAKAHGAFIDKTFEMELVGYVLTNRTFGVRVKLVREQCQLFDSEDGESADCSEASSSSSPSTTVDLPGIKTVLVDDWALPVTSNKAHITLGCAPGIPAVITGPDMLDVIGFEMDAAADDEMSQAWNITDPLLDDVETNNTMTVTEYNATAGVADKVFVIYPRVKILAEATFRPYYYPNSGGGGLYSGGGGLCVMFLLFLFSQICLHQYVKCA